MGRASQERRKRHETRPAVSGGGKPMWTYVAAGLAVVAVAVLSAKLLVRTQRDWKDGSPAWSPDGTRIAFYSERDGNAEIYVMQADGSGVTRLTHTKADEGYPSWSPDGRTISFDSDRDGNFEIYAMNADGSNVRPLTKHPARDVSASWSPDGSKIVFMSDRDGGFDAYEAAPDAGAPATRVTRTGTAWFPVFSPDGKTLAFHVGRDVHTMPAPPTVPLAEAGAGPLSDPPRRLTIDPANGMYPSWSPDGKKIAFMSWRNGRTELFTMNADGSNQQRLLSMDRGDAVDPRWSPDGAMIALVHMPDGMNGRAAIICVVNADGTALRHLR
jgi:Tol biopolymer transport system component